MNNQQLIDSVRLYETWSETELVRATTVDRLDYQPEAFDLMTQELSRRGVPLTEMACVEETVLKQVEAERNRLTGVRGVLGFFIVGFVVGSAAYVLYGLLLLATGIWLYAACGVLFLILAGYGFYASSLLRASAEALPAARRR